MSGGTLTGDPDEAEWLLDTAVDRMGRTIDDRLLFVLLLLFVCDCVRSACCCCDVSGVGPHGSHTCISIKSPTCMIPCGCGCCGRWWW